MGRRETPAHCRSGRGTHHLRGDCTPKAEASWPPAHAHPRGLRLRLLHPRQHAEQLALKVRHLLQLRSTGGGTEGRDTTRGARETTREFATGE